MPRGCLIVGLWCSADLASCRSYGVRSTSMNSCDTCAHYFDSDHGCTFDSDLWITHCVLVQTTTGLQSTWTGFLSGRAKPVLWEHIQCIWAAHGHWVHGTKQQGASNKLSWYTYSMGIELSAAAVLCFRPTLVGLCCTKMQPSYVSTETGWALKMIDAKNIDGPCRKIQSHYLPGLLTNIRYNVMNLLFATLKQFYFDFI